MQAYDVVLFGCSRRVGKDTAAARFEAALDTTGLGHAKVSFAAELRAELNRAFNSGTHKFLDMWTQDDALKDEIVRPLLIAWGCARRWQAPTYWVKRAIETLQMRGVGGAIDNLVPTIGVISDWRFPNEYHCFAEHGLRALPVYIERNSADPTDEETKWLPACREIAEQHGLILDNNGTIEQLDNWCFDYANRLVQEHCRVG